MAGSEKTGAMWGLALSCFSGYCHVTPQSARGTLLASHCRFLMGEATEMCVLEQIPAAAVGWKEQAGGQETVEFVGCCSAPKNPHSGDFRGWKSLPPPSSPPRHKRNTVSPAASMPGVFPVSQFLFLAVLTSGDIVKSLFFLVRTHFFVTGPLLCCQPERILYLPPVMTLKGWCTARAVIVTSRCLF